MTEDLSYRSTSSWAMAAGYILCLLVEKAARGLRPGCIFSLRRWQSFSRRVRDSRRSSLFWARMELYLTQQRSLSCLSSSSSMNGLSWAERQCWTSLRSDSPLTCAFFLLSVGLESSSVLAGKSLMYFSTLLRRLEMRGMTSCEWWLGVKSRSGDSAILRLQLLWNGLSQSYPNMLNWQSKEDDQQGKVLLAMTAICSSMSTRLRLYLRGLLLQTSLERLQLLPEALQRRSSCCALRVSAVSALPISCFLLLATAVKQSVSSTFSCVARWRSLSRDWISRSTISVLEVVPSQMTDSTMKITLVWIHRCSTSVTCPASSLSSPLLAFWQYELFLEESTTRISFLMSGSTMSSGVSPKSWRKLAALAKESLVWNWRVASMLAVSWQKSEEQVRRLGKRRVCWFLLKRRKRLAMPIQQRPGPQRLPSEQLAVITLQLRAFSLRFTRARPSSTSTTVTTTRLTPVAISPRFSFFCMITQFKLSFDLRRQQVYHPTELSLIDGRASFLFQSLFFWLLLAIIHEFIFLNFGISCMDSDSEQLDSIENEYDSECEQAVNETDYDEDFHIEKKEKKYQEMTFLLGCLKNHFIFYNLSEAEIENVAKKMFYCSVNSDTFVFKENTKAMCFFIIEKGMMQVISNDKIKKTLRVGDGFGEIALLYKSPRAFAVKACEHCHLWAIDRNTFRRAVEEIIILEYEENKKFMENVRFFSSLSNDHKDTIAGALITQEYAKGQVIVNEGDPGSSFYIIKEGTAAVYKGNKLMTKLEKTDSFGEQALFYNTVRQMTVKAQEDMTCLILGRQTLSKVLGDQIFVVTFRNFMKWAIEKSSHLSKLSKEQVEKILDLMKINSYKSGNVVIKKNTENVNNQKIIIVIEGALKKYKNINPIAVRSQIYGEEFLLQNKTKARYEDDIVMESDGVIAEIKVDIVKEIIGGFLDTVVEQNEKKQAQKFHEQIKRRNKLIDGLDQLVMLQELKEGEFGPILLVGCTNEIEKQKLFVLKCYSKQKIEEHSLFKYITQEKNLLRSLYHPFIMEYYRSFKDEHYLYSLVEFVQGEELYYAIREIGILSTEDTQFYIASMILILEYLSTQGVIMRDLKPENFMVDLQGYLKLIDLVAAKVVKGRNIMSTKTYTLIGTPHYMAPEIIIGKGYTFTVSLYSLGINMFEFMCGYVPFGEKSEDPLEIYEEILNLQLKYPRSLKDKKARKLMDQLLNKNEPESRLGGPTFMSLKNNPWFENINWDDLYERKIDAPKFDRNLNKEGTEFEITRGIRHAKNCVDYLDEKLPLRNVGENKTFTNW